MIIKKRAIEAALVASTSDDTRYFLNAINITPDGTVEATDGNIAFRVRDTAPDKDEDFPITTPAFTASPDKAILLNADIARRLLKVMPKRSTLPILQTIQISRNGDDHSAIVTATDLEMPATVKVANEGTFPCLDRVMPSANRPHIKISLSAAVLQDLAKAAIALSESKKGTRIVTFEIPTDATAQATTKVDGKTVPAGWIDSAIRATMKDEDLTLEAAVMPCRE